MEEEPLIRLDIMVNTRIGLTRITTPLTVDEHNAFVNDESAKNSYAESIIATMIQSNQLLEGSIIQNSILHPNIVIPETSELKLKVPEKKKPFAWTTEAAKALLTLRFERNDDFNRPSTQKLKLWQSIAEALKTQGYAVTGPLCDSKFRNLTSSYTTIKRRLSQTGEGLNETLDKNGKLKKAPSTNWEHFEQMDEHLKDKASILPAQKELLGSSFRKRAVDVNSNESADGYISGGEEDVDPNIEMLREDSLDRILPRSKRPKAQKLSVQEFLFKKMEHEKEKVNKRLEMESKRLEIEAKRVEALSLLANALASSRASQPSTSAPQPSPANNA